MRKLVLLCMLAIAPFVGLVAQTTVSAPQVVGTEVLWQLDSLMPCHFYQCAVSSKHTRDSLNKYNYALDSLPPLSSDLVEQRLRDLGAAILLTYNEDVQAFINLYTLQRRDQVERMLGLSKIYFPIFDAALDKAGMPMELRYLPIVESALNPHARSKVGATGLWQFMLTTGQMYDLEVTSFVDERRDPYKSTDAAVKYLGNMYKTYGDWLLVVAAYNCGPGNVNKAIARSGGKRTFWEIQEFLPRETRSYVPALIAATYVFNYATEHNLFPRQLEFTFQQDTVHVVRQQMNLKHFADITHTDFWLLKDLNPELKIDVIPYTPAGYELRVPMKTGQFYATYRDSIAIWAAKMKVDSARAVYTDARISPLTNKPYVAEASEEYTYGTSADSKKIIYHKVRRGEVVGSIAAKYHVAAKDISKWNGLRNYNIVAGQSLKIYVKGAPLPQTKVVPKVETPADPVVIAKPEPEVSPAETGSVAVAPADGEAKQEPAPTEAKTVANVEVKKEPAPVEVKKEPVPVEVKAVAKVEPKKEPVVVVKADPKENQKAMATMDAKYHVVKQGDTLWHIANAYDGLTVEKLMTLNQLPGNKLEIGQKLRIQ